MATVRLALTIRNIHTLNQALSELTPFLTRGMVAHIWRILHLYLSVQILILIMRPSLARLKMVANVLSVRLFKPGSPLEYWLYILSG